MKKIHMRDAIEWEARGGAGIIDTVDDYILVRALNRFNMYVHKDDKSVGPHLIGEGFWESWITTWVMNHVDEETMFLDIGANTGYYSFLASYLGAISVAFEPNDVYKKMISASNRQNKLFTYLYSTALSDYTGEAVLNIPLELHGSASLHEIPGYQTNKQPVRVQPLDDVLVGPSGTRQVVKIDAEGEEERIMRGARDFFRQCNDLWVMMEYTPGAYSEKFLDKLFDEWNVATINFVGWTEPVPPEWVRAQTDWVMLVLTPKR